MGKRIISIFLTMVMLVGLLPVGEISALAEGYIPTPEEVYENQASSYSVLKENTTELDGIYLIGSTTNQNRLTVERFAAIMVYDSDFLYLPGGILVKPGATLYILPGIKGRSGGIIYIGSSQNSVPGIENTNATVNIYGCTVTAQGGANSAGIGGGINGNGGTVNIFGGNVTAKGGVDGAGIGGGEKGSGGTVNITGGTVYAYGGAEGAGIGGGGYGSGGTVNISGGTVYAEGGAEGAGIGGGEMGSGGTVNILGGTVNACSGGWAAGIGGGVLGNGGEVNISGGTVYAEGNIDGAGIGGGGSGATGYGTGGDGGTVTISGGTVTAEGDEYGAGIGGGINGKGGTVTITGGLVKAYGGVHIFGHEYIGQPNHYSAAIGGKKDGVEYGSVTLGAHMAAYDVSAGEPGIRRTEVQIYSGVNKLLVKTTIKYDPGKNPGCTEGGYKPYYYDSDDPSVCFEDEALTVRIDNITFWKSSSGRGYIKPLGHTGGEIEYEWSSDFSRCLATQYCSVCGGIAGYEDALAISLIFDSIGNDCQTVGRGHYRASFRTFRAAETESFDTAPGPHVDKNGDDICDLCNEPFEYQETEGYSYYAYDSRSNAVEKKAVAKSSVNIIDGADDRFVSGYNVVTSSVSFPERITLYGEVNVILADGVVLTAEKGIHVGVDDTLSIYAQSLGAEAGTLVAFGDEHTAGIGGSSEILTGIGGTVNIHSGTVAAVGGRGGAGIGGGEGKYITEASTLMFEGGDCGTVNIYGGTVNAVGGYGGAGIGGGDYGTGGTVNIYAGAVSAEAGTSGIGIGGGGGRDHESTVNIYGGTVSAKADFYGISGSTLTLAEDLKLYSDDSGVMEPVTVSDLTMPDSRRKVYISPEADEAAATCETAGYKPCYYSSFYKAWFEDAACTLRIGDDSALSAWKAEGGSGYEPARHTLASAVYEWSGDHRSCTAVQRCTVCKKEVRTQAQVQYVKDTDAACDTPETGHYEASFSAQGLEKQITETAEHGSALGHSYAVHYYWNDNFTDCTAKEICSRCGKGGERREALTVECIEDTPADCINEGKLHYKATFSGFAPTESEKLSIGYGAHSDADDNGVCDVCKKALTDESYSFYSYSTEQNTFIKQYAPEENVNIIDDPEDEFESGVYNVVTQSVTFPERIMLRGYVNIILADGVRLNAEEGIDVSEGTTLSIYARSQGDLAGVIIAEGGFHYAGIGSGKLADSGTVNIHGGDITAISGYGAAGIGGGYVGNNGTVNIYGGTVTAKGYYGAAGIGGGSVGDGGTVNIYGGTVTAFGNDYSVAIGCGNDCPGSGTVNIYGGTVTAECTGLYSVGAGIGCADDEVNAAVNITGGTVKADGGKAKALRGKISFGSNVTAYDVTGGEPGKTITASDIGVDTHVIYVAQKDYVPGVSATCTESGYLPCFYDSGKYYEDAEHTKQITDVNVWRSEGGKGYIAPRGHNWEITSVENHRCRRCGEIGTHVTDESGYCGICHEYKNNAPGYSVYFDMNGYGRQIEPIYGLQPGDKIPMPEVPRDQNMLFVFWCDEATMKEWNFAEDTVSKDTTLLAMWVEKSTGSYKYTLTFEMNGHGKQIDPLTGFDPGEKLIRPPQPREARWIFDGWYKDRELTDKVNFSTARMVGDLTLYAKWIEDNGEERLLEISDLEEWNTFAESVVNGTTYDGWTVKLTADIGSPEEPVTAAAGDMEEFLYTPFCGTFDGCGHTLYLDLVSARTDMALFPYLEGATVKNLVTDGSVFAASRYNAAGIAYMALNSLISGCRNNAEIVSMERNAAGIAAQAPNTDIIGCVNTGAITGEVQAFGIAGGVIVDNSGIFITTAYKSTYYFKNCINCGTVTVTSENGSAAGLIGPIEMINDPFDTVETPDSVLYIENCASCGDITAKIPAGEEASADTAAAGIAEFAGITKGTTLAIDNCFVGGKLSAKTVCLLTAYDLEDVTGTAYGPLPQGEDLWGTITCDHLVTTLADVPVYGDSQSDIQPIRAGSLTEAARTLNRQVSKHEDWKEWTVENGQLVFGRMPDPELTPNVDGMYHITSEEDWDALAAAVRNGKSFEGETVLLETDITVTRPVGGFSSVQANDRPFRGSFDGCGHTLTLDMNTSSGSDKGAFSHTEGAVIRNLTVNGAVEGDSSIGGIVGNASHTAIENCTSNAAVTGHYNYIGGLVGYACDNTSFTGCENNAAVNGTQAVGGMAGLADNGVSFINCVNNGTVSAAANDTGGIVGFAGDGTTVLNCINTADITAKKYVGGILGNAVEDAGASVTVDNCINYGNITALSGGDNAGGIVGHMAYCGEVKNCFTSGAVSNVGNSAVVIGWANRNCGGESLYYQELEVNEDLPDVCNGTDFPAGAVKPSATAVTAADDASMLAALNAYVSGHAADASGRSYWTVKSGRAWLSFSDVLVHTHILSGGYINNDNGTHSRACSECGEYVAAPHVDINHNNVCDECGNIIVRHNAPFLFSSKSLALDSALAFRFFGYVGNEMPSDEAYMEFRIGDIRTVEVPFADAVEDSNGRYVFTCRLNVLEADEQIQATFHDGAAAAQRSGTVSVSDYLQTVRSNHADKTGNADKAAVDLIDAIFDYAHYCQTALDYTHAEYTVGEGGRYRATESAHEGIPLMTEAEWKQFKAVKKLKSGFTDVKSSSRTLVLDDETAIVIYLTPASDDYVPSVTVTKDKTGSPAEFSCEKQKDGRYRVIIPGIAAHQLADTFTVSIDGGKMSFTELSALSYAYSVFSADKGTEKDGLYKAAVSAMYAYYNATVSYRNCKK